MSCISPIPEVICYIPSLLPDELLYSWLGRLSVLNAWGTGRASARRLFGGMQTKVAIDLPARIQMLPLRLGASLPGFSLMELVERSTTLPYYRPFLEPNRYARVLDALLYGSSLSVRARLGLLKHQFEDRPALRFCPLCAAEDIRTFSCFYWHRQHHLPAVTCCAQHLVRLENYLNVDLTASDQCFIYPGLPESKAAPRTPSATELTFAKTSADLLSPATTQMANSIRAKLYSDKILELGYGTSKGGIDYVNLAIAIRQHYSDFPEFSCRNRLLSTPQHPLRWVHDVIERPSKSLHPISHVVLINFLYGSIDCFYQSMHSSENSLPMQNNLHPYHHHDTKTPPAKSGGILEGFGSSQIAERRSSWQRTLNANSEQGISYSRGVRPADYAWLYRHDRRWLLTTNHSHRKSHSRRSAVNWPERELLLCRKARLAARALYTLSPPIWVTANKILRELSTRSIRWSLRKLPELDKSLHTLSESKLNFMMRRIDYAVGELGADAILWKVQRMAGFRVWPAVAIQYAERKIANLQ